MSTRNIRSCVFALSWSLSLAVAACGGSDGAGGGGGGGNVTLDTLPADQRAAFEAWKARPVKDCYWSEAFPGLAEEALAGLPQPPAATPHVDVTALYAATHGSPVVQGDHGEIVLLGPAVEDSSDATNQLTQTYTTDNNVTRSLAVHAARSAGECVMTLGGAEVFRTRMAAAMEITGYADAASLAVAGTDLTAPTFDPSNAVGSLETAPLLAHVLGALAPTSHAQDALAVHFQADGAAAKQVFVVAAAQLPITVLPKLDGVPPVAPGAVMYGPRAAIAALGATGTSAGFDLVFNPALADAPTAEPDKLVVLRADIAVLARGANAHATALAVQPSIDRSDAAAITCFADRRRLAGAFATAASHAPGFDAVFASCRDLAADGYAALVADPASQQQIAQTTFTGPITAAADYLGWDAVLLDVVGHLLAAGTDLATLDPGHASEALDAALTRATTWHDALPSDAPADLRDAIVPTALRWTLAAVANLTALDRAMPGALTNAGATYSASVLRMMQDITRGLPAGLAAASCGAALAGDRAARVAATLAKAAALDAAQSFTAQLHDGVLQACPDGATLDRIDAAVDVAAAFVHEDEARGTSAHFQTAVRSLVGRALGEGWTQVSYDALGDLVALGVVRHPSCLPFPTYAERVLCLDAALIRFSAGRGKLLDPALAARQAGFARATLPARQDWLAAAAFARARSSLDVALFDRGLWTGCSDAGFAASQTSLLQTLDQLHAATGDPADLEDEIDAQLAATTCP